MPEQTNRLSILNRDAIKYIAMFTMLLNHIANIFLVPATPLYAILTDIGYFTAPTMCYFLVEGYHYTRSRRKYAKRLAAFALISQLPFWLAFRQPCLNMMFTLLLCFGLLCAKDRADTPGRFRFLLIAVIFASVFCDWAVLAPFMTLLFARCRDGELSWKNAYLCSMALFLVMQLPDPAASVPVPFWILSSLGGCAAIAVSGVTVRLLYNGRRMEHGRNFSKWFFYLFYPAHLLVLVLLRAAM